jgi:hypothetical protein
MLLSVVTLSEISQDVNAVRLLIDRSWAGAELDRNVYVRTVVWVPIKDILTSICAYWFMF